MVNVGWLSRGDRVEGLQPVAGVEQHDLGPRIDEALGEQLAVGRHDDAAGGLGEDALGARQELDAVDDLVVAHVGDRPTGPAHDIERVGPVRGIADRQRLGDGVGLDRADDVVTGVERLRHR